jgi:hypothetical protein
METRDKMRRMVVRHLLDRFGRTSGKVCPFYIYCKLPNYKPLVTSTEITLGEFHRRPAVRHLTMLASLKEVGVAYLEDAQILEDRVYFPYLHAQDSDLREMGFLFSLDEVEGMFNEAQTLSLKRYANLKRKQAKSLKFGGELGFSFPELYDLYGDRLVYFAHGPNGVGKSTWLQVQRKALARRKKVVWLGNGQWLKQPLANLQVVDSGEYLPESDQITRKQVIETIPLSIERYQECLRMEGPVAVGDAGDNVGQRIDMLIDAWKLRGNNCPTHVELFEASLLDALVRNGERARKEYTHHQGGIFEAFNAISELTTSCLKRDMSSPTYRRIYPLIYTDKWCKAEEPCRYKAHEPFLLCERWCNLCPSHCSQLRRGINLIQHTCDFPMPNDGVVL